MSKKIGMHLAEYDLISPSNYNQTQKNSNHNLVNHFTKNNSEYKLSQKQRDCLHGRIDNVSQTKSEGKPREMSNKKKKEKILSECENQISKKVRVDNEVPEKIIKSNNKVHEKMESLQNKMSSFKKNINDKMGDGSFTSSKKLNHPFQLQEHKC